MHMNLKFQSVLLQKNPFNIFKNYVIIIFLIKITDVGFEPIAYWYPLHANLKINQLYYKNLKIKFKYLFKIRNKIDLEKREFFCIDYIYENKKKYLNASRWN